MVPAEPISKFLTYLLRHRPKEYPLIFDRQGFVAWPDLFATVEHRFPDTTEDEVLRVIQDSKRFELREGKARATYGHSFPVELGSEPVKPPPQLYHGTARDLAESILRGGLKPRDRQFVHLSASLEDALAVGRRRDPSPAVIMIDAHEAYAGGVEFYVSGPLFLTASVPAKYLSLWRR
ncbi:MAG: RNA 2'-phosphotransferase [Candidatus Binatia bacterium]